MLKTAVEVHRQPEIRPLGILLPGILQPGIRPPGIRLLAIRLPLIGRKACRIISMAKATRKPWTRWPWR